MMNLTQARRYGLEVTSCMKTETDRVYKVFDSETGKYLSKEWENMPTMNKTLNKELAKRMGYDYETLLDTWYILGLRWNVKLAGALQLNQAY